MRSFIGISLPVGLKKDIYDIQKKLDSTSNKIKWVKKENLHLTLKFIGNISEKLTPKILNHMKEAVTGIKTLSFNGNIIGAFPKIRHPKVIWIGSTEKNNKLHELFQRVEDALFHLHIEKEKRKFHPHITIGRTKQFNQKKELINLLNQITFSPHIMKITTLTLYKSKLSPKGPIYKTLGKCELER